MQTPVQSSTLLLSSSSAGQRLGAGFAVIGSSISLYGGSPPVSISDMVAPGLFVSSGRGGPELGHVVGDARF